jgi:hypothetical protein
MGSKSNIHSKFLSVKLPITRSVALSRNSRAVDGQFGIIPGPKSGFWGACNSDWLSRSIVYQTSHFANWSDLLREFSARACAI